MSKKINGILGAIEQPEERGYTRSRGYYAVRKFECTSMVDAQAAAAVLQLSGYDWTIVEGIGKTILRAVLGADPQSPAGDNDYSDAWSVQPRIVQKDLLDSDHPLITNLNTTNFDELKKYIANPDTFESGEGFTGTVGGNSYDAAVYLFSLFRSGVRSKEITQPVLRLTRTVGWNYNLAWNVAGVNRLFTTASMMADSGVPANFVIPIQSLANEFTAPTRTDGLQLVFGWLKRAPDINQFGPSKLQITQEWEWGLWDTYTYGTPS